MKMLIRILAIMAVICLSFIFAMSVYATDPPDSTPTISDIKANVNLLSSGDVLIYGQYEIPYVTLPDESADETYVFRLIDTDGETQLGAVVPFVQFDYGYNKGVFSFYFSATDNLTTDEAYIIRISQNPIFFDDPENYDYVMPGSAWTSQTTQEANQTELAINIISMAEGLEQEYDEELLETSPGGTILSSPTGENYFRGCIYGIQAMAPSLFLVQVYSFETGDRAWTTEQFDEYDARFDDTWLGTTSENTSAMFGLSTQALMSLIVGMPIFIGSVVISVIKWRRADPAYLIAGVLLILLILMGWMSKPLFATLYQLLALYIGYLWFYARS